VDDLHTHKKLYFAGDTGYHTVRDGKDEDKFPVCPAFAEVGERFGGVDVALLPIGCCANIQGCEGQESPCHALGNMGPDFGART